MVGVGGDRTQRRSPKAIEGTCFVHAATSIWNCVRGLLCTSPAPGTIQTSAEQVPIPRHSEVPSGVSAIAVQCFESSAFGLGTSARHRVRFLFRAARHQHGRRQVGVPCPGRRRRVGAFSHRRARDGRSAGCPREGKTIWPSKEESTRSCHPVWLGFDFQGPAEEAVIAVQAPIRAHKNSGHQGFKHSFCS